MQFRLLLEFFVFVCLFVYFYLMKTLTAFACIVDQYDFFE